MELKGEIWTRDVIKNIDQPSLKFNRRMNKDQKDGMGML